ncbi:hypothetical protein B0H13DRAFT_1874248 [Mycena leptocephala]|nr:hypothetical protein B0H13DRAFT_1874248 [Mycena leptocephala]
MSITLNVSTSSSFRRRLFWITVKSTVIVARRQSENWGVRLWSSSDKPVGAIKSPQILELSGIGRKEILENIGVECKIDFRGVGQNVQDHTYLGNPDFFLLLGVSYELNHNDTHETYDLMRDPMFAAEAKRLNAYGGSSHPSWVLTCVDSSSELKGMHRIGITSFAYFPLQSATSEAPALIQKAADSVEVLKKSGRLEPGQGDILDKTNRELEGRYVARSRDYCVPCDFLEILGITGASTDELGGGGGEIDGIDAEACSPTFDGIT